MLGHIVHRIYADGRETRELLLYEEGICTIPDIRLPLQRNGEGIRYDLPLSLQRGIPETRWRQRSITLLLSRERMMTWEHEQPNPPLPLRGMVGEYIRTVLLEEYETELREQLELLQMFMPSIGDLVLGESSSNDIAGEDEPLREMTLSEKALYMKGLMLEADKTQYRDLLLRLGFLRREEEAAYLDRQMQPQG